jgi:hypothetical protein
MCGVSRLFFFQKKQLTLKQQMRRSIVIFAALAAPAAAFMPVSSASPLTTAQRGSVRSSPSVLHMAAEPSSRREFVGAAAGLAAGFVLPLRGGGSASAADAPAGPFKLPPLPYDYKALEPAIDEGKCHVEFARVLFRL